MTQEDSDPRCAIQEDPASRLLEALALANAVQSETIEGWSGQAYLQFKDHLDRYRLEVKSYSLAVRRQDRRLK